MKMHLIVRATFFTLLFPGTVTILGPCSILGSVGVESWRNLSILRFVAVIVGISGAATLIHCVWGFAFYGEGTLAPIDPPKSLIVRGLYQYNRNPMYLGVLTVLAAETLFFSSPALFGYSAVIFLVFHLFVLMYEEPHLKGQFGQHYLDYCRAVPRWGIALHPFNNSAGAT